MKIFTNSIGGIVEAVIKGCPPGLGDPCFDKLNARLGAALFSIATIKGVEFGAGFKATSLLGSQNNDIFTVKQGKIKASTNNAGGINGGISSGEDITVRMAVKPPSSIAKIQKSVTKKLQAAEIQVKGRHDPCLCPRVVPVAEAMIALTLVDCLMIQKSASL